ncbi:hypothetical protein ACJ41O_001010 [Fusarium nematophilum]
MAPLLASRKRKGPSEAPVVDDELAGIELDGVLSQSDDESGYDESEAENDVDHEFSEDDEEDPDDDGAYSDDTSSSLGASLRGPPALDNETDVPNYRVVKDANGGERYEYAEIDPVYDSDDSDGQGPLNTIGNIPLSFYDSYPHIGYDINGKKIMRPATSEALDALLDSIEVPKGWTGLTDPETGKPLNLSQDELELLKRLQMGEVPEEGYNPYPDMPQSQSDDLSPQNTKPNESRSLFELLKKEESYLTSHQRSDRGKRKRRKRSTTMFGQTRNPKILMKAWENQDPEEREKEYLPAKFDSLRKVPGYGEFVKERFDRCLDLYLAPRIRKNRLNIDPNSLLPKLPRPEDLKPFPTLNQTIFRGHDGRVRSVAFSPDGEFVASGGDDGTVRVWSLSGHQEWMTKLSGEEPVSIVRWRPNKETFILAAAAGEDLFFMIPSIASDAVEKASREVLDAGFGYATNGAQPVPVNGAKKEPTAKWSRPGAKLEDAGVLLKTTVRAAIKVISWHRRGEFLCSVSPTGQRSSVAIHTLSKHLSQIPFRKLPGLAQTAQFHPSRPLFFVATQRMIRCYDLQRQELVKVIQPGARWISSFDVHPGGDNLIVGSYDRRLLWHDLDLSARPYKTMRFHPEAIRAVKYHRSLPLFADASDDGTLQIFHGKVVSDLMENATIVPVKMLRGHKVVNKLGVMDVDWHPKHPWCLSAGADGTCRLWA